jgi:hypothetical protein
VGPAVLTGPVSGKKNGPSELNCGRFVYAGSTTCDQIPYGIEQGVLSTEQGTKENREVTRMSSEQSGGACRPGVPCVMCG